LLLPRGEVTLGLDKYKNMKYAFFFHSGKIRNSTFQVMTLSCLAGGYQRCEGMYHEDGDSRPVIFVIIIIIIHGRKFVVG
jgi:hypothetical protein